MPDREIAYSTPSVESTISSEQRRVDGIVEAHLAEVARLAGDAPPGVPAMEMPEGWLKDLLDVPEELREPDVGGDTRLDPLEGLDILEETDEEAMALKARFDSERLLIRIAQWVYVHRWLSWFVPAGYLVWKIDQGEVFAKGWPKPEPKEPKPLAHTWWGGHAWGPWADIEATVKTRSGGYDVSAQERRCLVESCKKHQAERISL